MKLIVEPNIKITEEKMINELREWANEYVPKFNKFGKYFFTQSPLIKATDVDVMLIGINPGGETWESGPITPEKYLEGNEDWENRFTNQAWGHFIRNGRLFLGCYTHSKTDSPIDDDRRTVWTNLVPIPSPNGFKNLTQEMCQIGAESTLKLIQILKPKRIVVFSPEIFDWLEKIVKDKEKIRHIKIIEKIEIGTIYDIPTICVNHPSRGGWPISNKFISICIFLHKLIYENNPKLSLKEAKRIMIDNEIKNWITRIGVDEKDNLYQIK